MSLKYILLQALVISPTHKSLNCLSNYIRGSVGTDIVTCVTKANSNHAAVTEKQPFSQQNQWNSIRYETDDAFGGKKKKYCKPQWYKMA